MPDNYLIFHGTPASEWCELHTFPDDEIVQCWLIKQGRVVKYDEWPWEKAPVIRLDPNIRWHARFFFRDDIFDEVMRS